MRVLIIAPNVSKPYLGPSTAAHHTLNGFIKIQKELEKYDVKITFLSLNDNVNKEISKNIEVISSKCYPPITFTGEFQAILRKPKEKFSIVHSHGIYDLLPYIISKTPTVFTLHGIFWREIIFKSNIYSKLYLKLAEIRLRYYYPRLAGFVAVSPYVIEELRAKGFDTGKAVVIENPISDDFFEVEKEEDNLILYPATINPLKNQLGFLKAVSIIKDKLKDYKIVFAGSKDSGYYSMLRKFVEKNGLNAVFLGKVPYNQMLRLYSKASLVALTSFQETLPMAVLEALATGTPVLTSNVGGLKYVVKDSFNGFLVDPSNLDMIAEKLLLLTQHERLRRRLGENAKKDAERFKCENIAKRLLRLYLKIAKACFSSINI